MSMDNKPDNLESVMRRIQKLLAIANDGRGNPEESAAAASMAQKIMEKYQLEHADLIIADLHRGDCMDEVAFSVKGKRKSLKKVPRWLDPLVLEVCRLNDVVVNLGFNPYDKSSHYTFCGYKADIAVAVWTSEYLMVSVNNLLSNFKKTDAYYLSGYTAILTSYREGVMRSILIALRKQRTEKEAQNEAATQTGNSLMVVKKQAVEAHFGEQKTKERRAPRVHLETFEQGVSDGSKIDVNRNALESTQHNGPLMLS